MLGQLPETLPVNGRAYKIRTDFRNILRIFEAFEDDKLSDTEKLFICLKRMYVDFDDLPHGSYQAAYEQACQFINCGRQSDKKAPRIVSWVRDEQLIFPAVNKAAGKEVRSVDYLHWWTFMGYFQCIDREDLWGTVLAIRQKRAKHKKLEKWEQDFYSANRDICDISAAVPHKTAEESLEDIFNSLLEG